MIRCTAIDDEPIALSIIREHCQQYGDITLSCFTSPAEGMAHIIQERPDIVFLDIELTSHNGLELARKLPEDTTLIFTTAYAEYALEGYNVNAIDFLHKPIFYPRFQQAIDKARRWMQTSKENSIDKTSIILKAAHKKIVVDIETINYIEAMDNYVKIFRKELPMVISQITMKDMEDMLPSEQFMRVHRSYIVRLGAIDRYTTRKISIRDCKKTIPIGRTYAEQAKRIIDAGVDQ